MMKKFYLLLLCVVIAAAYCTAQDSGNYKIYCDGDCSSDHQGSGGAGGMVLMGGGADVDAAFLFMIKQSGGGDFLVLRCTDDELYDPYILAFGGISTASTLVLLDRSASFEPAVAERIRNAEAIFLAGGDQNKYYSYWKNSPVSEAIMYAVEEKKVPIGGTSAGLASLSEYIYSAETGSIVSDDALYDPFDATLTLGVNFLRMPLLQNTITDTHFHTRDRMGRLVAFVARLLRDSLVTLPDVARGIGVDQGAALCVHADGVVDVVGWEGGSGAYLLSAGKMPATCEPSEYLEFDDVSVTRVTCNATAVFNLSTWTSLVSEDDMHVEQYTLSASRGELTSTAPGGGIYGSESDGRRRHVLLR